MLFMLCSTWKYVVTIRTLKNCYFVHDCNHFVVINLMFKWFFTTTQIIDNTNTQTHTKKSHNLHFISIIILIDLSLTYCSQSLTIPTKTHFKYWVVGSIKKLCMYILKPLLYIIQLCQYAIVILNIYLLFAFNNKFIVIHFGNRKNRKKKKIERKNCHK